jgi:hypothetical protein
MQSCPSFAAENLALQGKIQVRHALVLSFLPCISETGVWTNRVSLNESSAAG